MSKYYTDADGNPLNFKIPSPVSGYYTNSETGKVYYHDDKGICCEIRTTKTELLPEKSIVISEEVVELLKRVPLKQYFSEKAYKKVVSELYKE